MNGMRCPVCESLDIDHVVNRGKRPATTILKCEYPQGNRVEGGHRIKKESHLFVLWCPDCGCLQLQTDLEGLGLQPYQEYKKSKKHEKLKSRTREADALIAELSRIHGALDEAGVPREDVGGAVLDPSDRVCILADTLSRVMNLYKDR